MAVSLHKQKGKSNFLAVLKKLPKKEQEAIIKDGLSFRVQELENKTDLARQKIVKFEYKYGCALNQLEKDGLPDNADVSFHEEYIEWKYWNSMRQESDSILSLIRSFTK